MKRFKEIGLMMIFIISLWIFAVMPATATTQEWPPAIEKWKNTGNNTDITDVATFEGHVAFIDLSPPSQTVFVVHAIDGTNHWNNTSVSGYSIAAGDVDGDEQAEVIAGGRKSGTAGITVFDDEGNFKFFYPTNSEVVKDIELGDVNNDGVDEIVACNGAGTDQGYIYVINGTNGSNISGWPKNFPGKSIIDVALGTLDRIPGKDIAAISSSTGTLYVFNGTGGWNNTTVKGRSVKIGNVDSDEEEEVVIGDNESNHVYVYNGSSGTLKYSLNTASRPSEVELGDLDDDGTLEIAAITEDEGTLYAIDINSTGQANEMWNYTISWRTSYYGEGLAIGDVDRDYKAEVIAASSSEGSRVYAFDGIDSNRDGDGDVVWVSNNLRNPINDIEIADLDDDGDMDVIVGTSGGQSVYALSTQEHTVQVNGNNVYFDSDPSNITDVTNPPMPPNPPAGYNFPYGVFSINITVPVDGWAIITITLPDNLPAGSVYWKYSANGNGSTTGQPGWYQIPLGDNDGDNVITITLQDGGIGDADGAANGVIVDQGGPALPHHAKVPALTPIGIMALVGLFSIVAVISIRKKKT